MESRELIENKNERRVTGKDFRKQAQKKQSKDKRKKKLLETKEHRNAQAMSRQKSGRSDKIQNQLKGVHRKTQQKNMSHEISDLYTVKSNPKKESIHLIAGSGKHKSKQPRQQFIKNKGGLKEVAGTQMRKVKKASPSDWICQPMSKNLEQEISMSDGDGIFNSIDSVTY